MALDTCNVHHGVKATGHCFSCHKPTCPQCRPRDGCCSDLCAANKAKFAGRTKVPRPSSIVPTLVGLAVLGVAGYLLARFMGYV